MIRTIHSPATIPSIIAQKKAAMTPRLMKIIAAINWREKEEEVERKGEEEGEEEEERWRGERRGGEEERWRGERRGGGGGGEERGRETRHTRQHIISHSR